MTEIHIRTAFEHVAEALVFLAPHAKHDALALPAGERIEVGAPVFFRVTLEDDTRVIEGSGRCRAVRDRGPGAEAGERYEVTISALDLDARNRAMLERILRATSEPPRALGAIAELDATIAPEPPLPPFELEAPVTPHAATRVVRTEDLLRVTPDPEGTTLPVDAEVFARAAALAVTTASSPAAMLEKALRVGLAALEAARDD